MKKIILAGTLVVVALGLTVAQENSKQCACNLCICEVTAEKVAQQPKGKTYVIEPGNGQTYRLAPGTDFGRVSIRTSDGEKPVTALVKGLGKTDGPILFGAFSDLSMPVFGQRAGDDGGYRATGTNSVTGAKHDGTSGTWSCKGYRDCNDLDKSGLCWGGKNGMSCNQKNHTCVCLDKS